MAWNPSLSLQTTAIIVASFHLWHVAGLLFYNLERRGALAMAEAVDQAERAAGIARFVRNLPADWRTSLLRSSDSRAFRMWLSSFSAVEMRGPEQAEIDIDVYLRTQVPLATD